MRTFASRVFLLSILVHVPGCLDESASPGDGGAVDGPPVTRSQVIATADQYASVQWTMTEENRTGITCGGTFVSNYPVGARVGVGYKWGDWTHIDEFLDKISQGYATGTGGGLDYETIPFDCVVGVSCTGLVSRAWHLDHKYTLNYPDPAVTRKFSEITHPIDGVDISAGWVDELRKGDALINSYHTMLFVYETTSGVPMIIDSSLEGVRLRSVSWGTLAAEGYEAIRYNNIVEDDDPAGTISNPIDIQLGTDAISIGGNTRDVVSLRFDGYSGDPAFRQPGPEIIYRLMVAEPGVLTASINDLKSEGIDNNLFLLSSLDRDASLMALDAVEAGDSALQADLDAGTWYLIVDGGDDLPGRYTLELFFRKETGSWNSPAETPGPGQP